MSITISLHFWLVFFNCWCKIFWKRENVIFQCQYGSKYVCCLKDYWPINYFDIFSANKEFIEHRRKSLRRFLNLVARHPVLTEDKIVKFFLTFTGSVSLLSCFAHKHENVALVLNSHSSMSKRIHLLFNCNRLCEAVINIYKEYIFMVFCK